MIDTFSITCIDEKSQRVVRRVSFENSEDNCISESETIIPQKAELWYQKDELVEFKEDLMKMWDKLRVEYLIEDLPLLDAKMDLALQDKNCCARGIENLVSTERQRNRVLAKRAILKAQERYQDPKKLALIASKCTAWAKEVALCTGYQDFYQVYKPEMSHLVPQRMSTKFPVQLRKRQGVSLEQDLSEGREFPSKKRRNTW